VRARNQPPICSSGSKVGSARITSTEPRPPLLEESDGIVHARDDLRLCTLEHPTLATKPYRDRFPACRPAGQPCRRLREVVCGPGYSRDEHPERTDQRREATEELRLGVEPSSEPRARGGSDSMNLYYDSNRPLCRCRNPHSIHEDCIQRVREAFP
jgi:hypothetical protein